MGNQCCIGEKDNFSDEIMNSSSIEEIRKYIIEKIDSASLEQSELKLYLKNNKLIPTSIIIDNFEEKDIKKRIPYLDEIKKCLFQINDLLEKNPNVDLLETKRQISEFYEIYTWLYDDEKRYEVWMMNFQNFINGNYENLNYDNFDNT
jgi:hypothetical protein